MINISDFIKLGIKEELVNKLSDRYITDPTPIQTKAIPLILKNRDIIGKAQTGTGKTLAFALPIVQDLDRSIGTTQALILTPTRELAKQIVEEFENLMKGTDLSVVALYGGHSADSQSNKLKNNAQVVVGTPGRILEHLREGNTNFKHLGKIVIDEADQMMTFGFLEDIELIFSKVPKRKNILIFSATIPDKIRKLARRVMSNPVDIDLSPKQLLIEDVRQVAVRTTEERKSDTLSMVLQEFNPFMAIIFCKSRERADKLHEYMYQQGLDVEILHGEFSQKKRETILKKFRELKFPFLVTTDITARGMDIEGVTHVVNYDVPAEVEYFVHRVGRTGRAGEKGTAITLISDKDQTRMDKIKKALKINIKEYYDRSDYERKHLKVTEMTGKS